MHFLFLLAIPLAVSTKIIAVAVAVYGVLQLVKKFLPVSGMLAFVANIVLSVVGVITVVQPDQLFSLVTLFQLLAVVGTAAGIHGTVASATKK